MTGNAKDFFWLVLCVFLAGAGTASAQDVHDHDSGHGSAHVSPGNVQGQVTSLIKELELPEGISSAQSLSIDSSGRLWFTEKIGRKLVMYDQDQKKFSTHSLPQSWGEMGFSHITIGPDDDIWFTVTRWVEGAEAPNIIGRFSPADGYFTKYTIPHKSLPEELMVDARGAIWFFASNKNNLYRVDPVTFALKGFPIPGANGSPKSLASDQKGHVWFVEPNANKIIEFNPDEELFHEHELLTQFANPGDISIDKQGRIWFVEVTANRIGMFSPDKKRFDGAIIPTPGSSPSALINDDNGNIWFLEYKGNKVGVFNSEKATFHEYDIPNYASLPADMVIDRKRSMLWFTQSATEAKRLGMISINEALAESNRQNQLPEKAASDGSMLVWLASIIVLIGIATPGLWLIRRHRMSRKS